MKYTSMLIECKYGPIISFCGIVIHYSTGSQVNTKQHAHQNNVQQSGTAEICFIAFVYVHMNLNNYSDYPESNFKGLKRGNKFNPYLFLIILLTVIGN